MDKQKRQLLFMVLLLVILVGGYFGLMKYNEYSVRKEQEQAESEIIYITRLEADDIHKISYQYEGETISLVKNEDVWVSESDTSLAIVQDKAETMAKRMSEIQAQQVISDVTDKEQYGLGDSARKVTFGTENATYTFFIGDYNSAAAVYYWGDERESTAYVVDGVNVTCFNYGLEDLIEEAEESAEDAVAE